MSLNDPAEIDLEALATKHATGGLLPSEVDSLFAAVEALRERVADLEAWINATRSYILRGEI